MSSTVFKIKTHRKSGNPDKSRLPLQIKERETGFEPAAPTLARWCSTPEPLAHFKKIFNFDTYLQNHILIND